MYFSTDYVFDGTKDGPYVEWDPPNPQSVYGRSKLAGELEARDLPGSTILRLSWVCGEHGANMVKTVLRLASERDELAFVDDQRGHPTFAESVAPLVRRLVGERRPGLFHVTNQGVVTWYDFARAIFELAGPRPGPDPPHHDGRRSIRRGPRRGPANSVLDNAALRLQGLPLLPDYRECLELARAATHPPVTDAAPEVRVVVVNYNGGEMTLACLRAIDATEWPRDALHMRARRQRLVGRRRRRRCTRLRRGRPRSAATPTSASRAVPTSGSVICRRRRRSSRWSTTT